MSTSTFNCLVVCAAALMSACEAQAQVGHRLGGQQAVAANAATAAIPMMRTLPSLPTEALADVRVSQPSPSPPPMGIAGNPGAAGVAPLSQLRRTYNKVLSGAVAAPRRAAVAPTAITPQNYGLSQLQSIYHYSDYLVSEDTQTQAPHRFSGWFLFTAADNGTYRCTASLIAPSILVTAGHCVHQGGNGDAGWIRSGTFYPAYRGGESPLYGSATSAWVIATSGWYSQGQIDQGYDVGLIVLN